MDFFLLNVYLDVIKNECEKCVEAARTLNLLLQNMGEGSVNLIFKELYLLINHAAAISRILWPSRVPSFIDDYEAKTQRAFERGEELRTILNIADNHPIKRRQLRNLLEHFDHHLDDWADESVRKNLVRDAVCPRNMIGGVEDSDIFNLFDPVSLIYYFRGQTFDTQQILNAASNILQRINQHQHQQEQRE